GRRLDPVLPENGGNGPTTNGVAQIRKRALDARVPPVAILRRHPHNQPPNLGGGRWPPWPAPVMAVVLSGDEMAMPGEKGVRAHNGRDLLEHASPRALRLGSQANALVVGRTEDAANRASPEGHDSRSRDNQSPRAAAG